ncbi:MAG: hypothetical protein JWQ76_1324 [Ramlibacter sp.]|nr:hypothetical protein [Ramlibacter sp.]
MKDHSQAWAVSAGVGCALLSVALGSSGVLWALSLYWMFGSTAVAFTFGAAVRNLLDSPGMYPRSMKAIARAAEDRSQGSVYRRTAVALYLYMAGTLFAAAAFCTILLVSFIFFRK